MPTAVERSLDLATLSHRDAQRLDGQRVRVRVELETLPGDADGPVVYDWVSPDDVNCTVWLVPGQEAKDVMDVEGGVPPALASAGQRVRGVLGVSRRGGRAMVEVSHTAPCDVETHRSPGQDQGLCAGKTTGGDTVQQTASAARTGGREKR
jgi:hypothetical protein